MLTSPDSRLDSVIKELNYCCGWFARNPKDIKEAAFQALGAYNFFYENPDSNFNQEEMDLLFTTIKFLGNYNSIQRKQEFMKEYWIPLKAKLINLGIVWSETPKPV